MRSSKHDLKSQIKLVKKLKKLYSYSYDSYIDSIYASLHELEESLFKILIILIKMINKSFIFFKVKCCYQLDHERNGQR